MLNCKWINRNLAFNHKTLSFCCGTGQRKKPPLFPYLSSPEETIVNFLNNKKLIRAKLRAGNDNLIPSCRGCPRLIKYESDAAEDDKLEYINLSFYPSVCQSKCIYCGYANNKVLNNYEEAKKTNYARHINGILPYLKENRCLDEANLIIQCSPGEITIHPHKDLILNALKGYQSVIFTNSFAYDGEIAEILRTTNSYVQTDIDAGTRETFKEVKGLDMFVKVVDNLGKYNQSGKVTVKYLVLPGVNDGDKDFDGVVDILKSLGLNNLLISKDNRHQSTEYWDKVCRSIAVLMNKLSMNGIGYQLIDPVFGKYENLVYKYYNIHKEKTLA